MNVKPVLRYQLHEYFQVFYKVYGFVYVMIVTTITLAHTQPSSAGSSSGMESMTMITSFIVGLVLFKSSFRFFSSYGVSRKRLFSGMAAAMGITSAATALLDMVNFTVFSHFISYSSFYEGMVDKAAGNSASRLLASYSLGTGKIVLHVPTAMLLLKNCLWCLLSYFALGMLGFFIAVLYYRMSKTLRILVSVGVPAIFFILIPLLDHNVTGGRIGAALSSLWNCWTLWGLNPCSDLVSRLLLIAVLSGVTYTLLQKAEVKA